MYLFELEFLSFLDICLGVGLLDHMATLFLVFGGTSELFTIVVAPVDISTNSGGGLRSILIAISDHCACSSWILH